MKINLIAPETPFLEEISMPPLNLMYLESYLNNNGYDDTHIIDLNFVYTHNDFDADVFLITSTTSQFPYAIDFLHKIIDHKNKANRPVTIIGGSHPTGIPESCKDFDKVIIGEGEIAIIQCLRDIDNNVNVKKHYYIGTPIKNIDELPIPSRKKNIERFKNYRYFITGELSTIAMTSRGCAYNCYFCSKIFKITKFFSTKYVQKELEDIKECGYNGIYFVDDIFTLRDDIGELNFADIVWKCQIRPDEKIENIDLLNKMGCKEVNIGIESGSQNILDTVNKKVKIDKIYNIVKECKKFGIKIRSYIIVGLPGETHDTINDTIEFLRKIDVDSVGVGTFIPYPGTYIYNNINKFDIKIEEKDYKKWYFRAGNAKYNCVVSTSGLTSKEILDYRNKIDKEFNN